MTPFVFILAVLAVYRLTVLVTHEEGPFGAFAWLREKIDPAQKSWLGRGLNCPACVSFWISLAAAWLLGGGVLEWLGIAGAVIIVNKVMSK